MRNLVWKPGKDKEVEIKQGEPDSNNLFLESFKMLNDEKCIKNNSQLWPKTGDTEHFKSVCTKRAR